MGFRQKSSDGRGGYARIWSVENKGNYSLAKVSTSKKREDGSYETDFQDGFVRLIGSAHEKVQTLNIPDKGLSIQITSCEVTTPYNAETKRGYTNYAIFAFDLPDSNDSNNTTVTKNGKKSAAKTSKGKNGKANKADGNDNANNDIIDDEDISEDALPF